MGCHEEVPATLQPAHSHPMCWYRVCTPLPPQAWSKSLQALKAAKKKKAKKAAAGADTPDIASLMLQPAGATAVEALQALQRAAAGLMGALQAAAAQAAAALPAAEAVQALLRGVSGAEGGQLSVLVGWEPRLKVQGVLQGLVEEQRHVLGRAKAAAGVLQQRSQALGWGV